MVPVTLSLRNFMSYGEEAPVLDFQQFHTVCLSGGNGQGKSALLDALTWALWGKARKASATQQPGSDLLRIGKEEMQVTFVFDCDAASRYRVIRTFNGLQRKTYLEIHAFNKQDLTFRSMSGTSVTRTQSIITGVVGLDYDTFINSALLLQGRSDEFAKRPPRGRKEILAQILNLDRYERLRQMAKEEQLSAQRTADQAEGVIARLRKSLEGEKQWKLESTSLQEDIGKEEAALHAARVREEECIGKLVRLNSLSEDAAQLRADLGKARSRLQEHRADEEAIINKLEEIASLIERAPAIRSRYARMLELQEERRQAQERANVYRRLERERGVQGRQLVEKQHEAAIKLQALSNQLENSQRALQEVLRLESEAPGISNLLEAAREAVRQETKLRIVKSRIEWLNDHIRRTERRIEQMQTERASLAAALDAQVDTLTRKLEAGSNLADEHAALQKKVERYEAYQTAFDTTNEERARIAGEIKAGEGRVQGLKEQQRKAENQLDYLRSQTAGQCPTCGTQLTSEHRAQVDGELRTEITDIARMLAKESGRVESLVQQRGKLRARFISAERELKFAEKARGDLVRIERDLLQLEQTRKECSDIEGRLASLREELAEEAFARQERTVLRSWRQELDSTEFDERAFEKVQHEAAQVKRYEEHSQRIARAMSRKSGLVMEIRRMEDENRRLRRQIDSGVYYGSLQARISRLDRQIKELKFDAEELTAVEASLEQLGDAGRELAALEMALQENETLKERMVDTRRRSHVASLECDTMVARVTKVEGQIGELKGIETEVRNSRKTRQRCERELNNLHIRFGEVGQRLAKAREDRRALKENKRVRRDAARGVLEYKALAQAFGKHGIPSLIIEEALPDIEDRTNRLLERLTEGRMRIRLDTQRSSQKGGTIETLDIRINDEMGEYRAYETYSGGEAYRINIALRLALSQLLAVRSGTQIQLLVIDEGFGTQDQSGVQSLIQAIDAVRDDFAKIIVITHLPEVKEAFPFRIEVRKHPGSGSHFDVIRG